MHEVFIKRTIWIAKCPKCEDSVEKTENPPRERRCMTCEIWVPFEEVSFLGPDLNKK